MNKPTCSVIVPVYNSAQTLKELTDRLGKVLPQICSDFELILINDGSQDESWLAINALSVEHPWVRGINLMRNYGQHNALLCGVRAARFDLAVTMDDDLQHPPEEIDKLIAGIADGFDVVYGIPQNLPHAPWRNFFSRITKKMLAFVMGIPSVRDIGSFRAFKTSLRQAFSTFQSPNIILDVLLSWGTGSFSTVLVDQSPRQMGVSNYNFKKLFLQAMLILTGYSTLPLRFASLSGFLFTIFGIVIFIYVVVQYYIAGSIPGFPFLASLVSLFSGMQLFALGIFGEYLARMFDRSMDRPTYVVSSETTQAKTVK